MIFTAGITPRVNGELQYVGPVGGALSVEDGVAAAHLAASNGLAAVLSVIGSQERIDRMVRLVVYINAGDGFVEHSQVADGATDYLTSALGEAGLGVRSAIGVSSLPGGATIEIEMTCAVRH